MWVGGENEEEPFYQITHHVFPLEMDTSRSKPCVDARLIDFESSVEY